jgi:hypothetical protein
LRHRTGSERIDAMRRKALRVARVVAVPVVLALTAVGLQFALNSVRDRPRESGEALALVIRGVHPERGRSLRADAWMFAEPSWRGCPDSATVRVVFSGTPAFWKDHAAELRGTHRFALGIVSSEGLEIRDVKFGFAAHPKVAAVRPEYGGPEPFSDAASSEVLDHDQPKRRGQSWLIAGTVRDWGVHWSPLAVEFTADWVSTRTVLGSCYLRLPSLTGTAEGPRRAAVNTALGSLFGAEDVKPVDERAAREIFGSHATPDEALSQRIDRELEHVLPASAGRIVVDSSGELVASESSPSPGAASADQGIWTCAPSDADRELEPGEGKPSASGEVIAYAPSAVAGQDLGCEGTAVIRSPSLEFWRSALLVLIGILAAWAVDSARKVPERWRGKGPEKP